MSPVMIILGLLVGLAVLFASLGTLFYFLFRRRSTANQFTAALVASGARPL